jgi:hypothetical protein
MLKVGFAAVLGTAGIVAMSCNGSTSNGPTANGSVGSVDIALVAGGVTLNSVSYTLTGPNNFSSPGTINVASSTTLTTIIGGIPAGNGYSIALSATGTDGSTCGGSSASFNVTAGAVTAVSVTLDCHQPSKTGSVSVNGTINVCPVADGITATPAETTVGTPVTLTAVAHDADNGPSPLAYSWSAPSGSFTGGTTATPTFVCGTPGPVTLSVSVSDGDPLSSCAATASVVVTCDPLLQASSLVISTSTYDRTQGAVSTLAVGTALAGSKTATSVATSNGNYVTVWNNEKVDASFGVTSPIQLLDMDPATHKILGQITVPTSQVVTSFPSKSEVGLHITKDGTGNHLVFVGYGGAGVGALDISNSDAVAGQDPTNPVTHAFPGLFAPRTIVSMNASGQFVYTPTINYGGNNGRSALLSSNGLYYTVGNANNGDAAAFGSATNGTNPDVTETTGLEAVTPINAAAWNTVTPTASGSSEINPLLQMSFGSPPKADKAGKDDNFRGVTEFGGALYFTKGSGSNGVQTVYTALLSGVPGLPTVAQAASATVSIVPGFPTDQAKLALADTTSGGNNTPFAVFFGNATTMYVSDEGTGNSTDASTNAGLQKWTLNTGTGQWSLAYILKAGAIGTVDSGLNGADGAWPNVTTIGLRNLTGVVNGDAVTLWAATSTLSTSGDNGADPNKIVTITDSLSATTLPASESFSTVIGPTYGTVYRGVAFVNP